MKFGAVFAALAMALPGCATESADLAAPEPVEARQHSLAWTGEARIHAEDRIIPIGLSTRLKVLPLDDVRSETWLLRDGPEKKRAMVFKGGQGWIERDGRREPMAEPMRLHELQQYGAYELMLLAILHGPALAAAGQTRTTLTSPTSGRSAEVFFDKRGRLTELRNKVSHSEDPSKMIEQRFLFSGEIADDGVRWPRQIEILHNGQPYFTLNLSTFDAEPL